MIYSKHWSHLDVFHVVAAVVVAVVRKSSKHENEKKSRINYVSAAAGGDIVCVSELQLKLQFFKNSFTNTRSFSILIFVL